MNFLESLVAEWFSYKEYFVRSNVHVHPLKRGGYGAELDVLAYSTRKGELIHIETSSDAQDWQEREKRIRKKFILTHEEYESIFNVKVKEVKKIAICGFSKQSNGLKWGDIEVKSIREFAFDISKELFAIDYLRRAVPESYPLLRAVQIAGWATKKPKNNRRIS